MELHCKFVGRRTELLKLRKGWDKCNIFGIFGASSMGKTRLAKQFMFYVQHFQKIDELWIDLEKVSSIRRFFISMFAKLKMIFVEREDNIWLYQICNQFIKLQDSDFVIIFDNAEDIIDTELCIQFLFICKSILSTCSNVKIFIVSTTSIDLTTFDRYIVVDLEQLTQNESIELLQAAAPSVEFGDCLNIIARLCEGFPLALLMCAAELVDNQAILAPEDMVDLLIQSRLQVLSPEFYPKTDRFSRVYLDFIKRLSPLFQQRMAILATIPGTFSSRHAHSMLELSPEDDAVTSVLKPTTDRHMTEYDSICGRYDICGIIKECICIHLILKDMPGDAELRRRFCSTFVEDFLDISRQFGTKGYMEALCRFNTEETNFQKLITDVVYCTEDTYNMYIQVAMSSSGVIQTFIGKRSFRFYEECIRMTQKYEQQLDEACVKVSYGCALTDLKCNLKTAERNYHSAIEKFKYTQDTLSRNHLHQLASAYKRLGFNFSEQGKYQEALRILGYAFKRLNDIKVEFDDRILLNTLTIMGLSHMYMCTGSIIVNTLRALGVFTFSWGRLLFTVLSYVGLCSSNAGHLRDAKSYLLEVKDRRLKSCVVDAHKHPLVGYCYNNLGVLYRKMGNYQESVKYYELGLDVKISTNAPDHSVALSLNNIAVSLSESGDHKKALEELEKGFKRLDKYHGLFPQTRSTLLATKGQILLREGQQEEAMICLIKTCRIQRKHQPNNKCLLKTYLYLLWTYLVLNKYQHAAIILYHGFMLLLLLCYGRFLNYLSKLFSGLHRHSLTLLFIVIFLYFAFFFGISIYQF